MREARSDRCKGQGSERSDDAERDVHEPAMNEETSWRVRGGDSGPVGTAGELEAKTATLTFSFDFDVEMGDSSCEVSDWRLMGCVRERELMLLEVCDISALGIPVQHSNTAAAAPVIFRNG